MDNGASHRKNVIQDFVKAAGHTVLFLPKYSSDLSKIEHNASGSENEKSLCSSPYTFGFSHRTVC
ncbi:MAG: transposase [Pseudanabaenaceae cyanobacterium]